MTSIVALVISSPCVESAELGTDSLETVRQWLSEDSSKRASIESLNLPDHLTLQESKDAVDQLWQLVAESHSASNSSLGGLPDDVGKLKEGGEVKLRVSKLALGEYTMPFAVIRRGKAEPPAKHALFLCLHGGGQHKKAKGPHSWPINSREWQSQVNLALQAYPSDGIYWIPRMADDRQGRWWHKHNQIAIDEVIDHAIAHWNVDPNRVYLLGISEGGYGTDILAPFMADRFAGASAMAAGVGLGNPPENLRNIAFRSDVGENDNMFDRKKMAVAFHQRLSELHEGDPKGYVNSINLQKGRGHGIDYREGPTWISKYNRTPFPEKVVWIDKPLDKVRRDQFYWIGIKGQREGRNQIVAQVDQLANQVTLQCDHLLGGSTDGHPTHIAEGTADSFEPLGGVEICICLSDALVDLEKPVEVILNGKTTTVTPNRSYNAILQSLIDRPDPAAVATQRVVLGLDK